MGARAGSREFLGRDRRESTAPLIVKYERFPERELLLEPPDVLPEPAAGDRADERTTRC